MTFGIHPRASAAFNVVGESLLEKVEVHIDRQDEAPGFAPDVHIAAHIQEKDIIGDIDVVEFNADGVPIARIFVAGGQRYVIRGESYLELRRLCAGMRAALKKHASVSHKIAEEAIIAWIKEKLDGKASSEMSEAVIAFVASRIAAHTVWIPIAQLHLEVPISIGETEIRQIDWNMFEGWKAEAIAKNPGAQEGILEQFQSWSRDLRGLAVARTVVTGDSTSAEEIGARLAEEAASLIRMFTPAALLPNQRSYCTPLGLENTERYTRIRVSRDKIVGLVSGLTGPPTSSLVLGKDSIAKMRRAGLDQLIEIYAKPQRTDLEERSLSAVMMYSRMTLFRDHSDKLVYILAALECVLLKNETEPIQQNLSERLALLVGGTFAERKNVIQLLRSSYSRRSRVLHHGTRAIDGEQLKELMKYAWHGLFRVISHCPRFKTRDMFLSAIDDMKLKGTAAPS